MWPLACAVFLVLAAVTPSLSEENLVDPTGTAGQEDPRMGVDGQGNVLAIWQDWREGGGLRSAYRPSGGPWESSVPVDPSSTAYQGLPGLVVDTAGNGYAVWEDRRGNLRHTRFAYRPAGGDWGPSEVVSPSTERQLWPVLAGNSQGGLVAAWTQDAPDGNYDVYAAVRPAGGAWGTGERVTDTTGSAHAISVAMDAMGGAYAIWKDDRNGGNDLYFSARTPVGVWTPNVRVNDDTAGASLLDPDLAVDNDGNLHAIWWDTRNGSGDIYADYRPAGSSWGQDARVSDDVNSSGERDPALTILPGNYVAAVWVDDRDQTASIYGSGRPAGGSWGGNVLLHAWAPSRGLGSSTSNAADPMWEGMFFDPRLLLLNPNALLLYYATTIEDIMDAPPFVAYYLTGLLWRLGVIPDEVFLRTGDIQPFIARLINAFGHAMGEGRDGLEPEWAATGGDLSTTTGFSTEYTARETGDQMVTAALTYELEGGASSGMARHRLTMALSDTAIVHVSASAERLDPSPAEFSLSRNHPNPVSSRTTVEFGVPAPCRVVLGIYDAMGRHIASAVDSDHGPGTYRVELECESLPPGVYLYRIGIGGFTASRAMVVAK
jgi:hypothetical protein